MIDNIIIQVKIVIYNLQQYQMFHHELLIKQHLEQMFQKNLLQMQVNVLHLICQNVV